MDKTIDDMNTFADGAEIPFCFTLRKVAGGRAVGATPREVEPIKKSRQWTGEVFLVLAVVAGAVGLWWFYMHSSTPHTPAARPQLSIPLPTEPSSPAVRPSPAEGENWTSLATGMEFVWIEALGLWVGKYEVTNGEYRKMDPSHNSENYENHDLNRDRQPVVYMNFSDARKFADWMTQRDQEKLGSMRYRVPSENEFRTITQCGDGREYPWGNNWPPTSGQAGNYADETAKRVLNSKFIIRGYDDGNAVSCDVEKSWENPWGLYGVGGNVTEVCASDDDASSFGAWRDATWRNDFRDTLRSAFRFDSGGSTRNNLGGFRLVLSPPSTAASRKRTVPRIIPPEHPQSSDPVPTAPSNLSTRHDVPVKGENWISPTTGMEFVWIQSLGLWVGKYEVTNGEYQKMYPKHDSLEFVTDYGSYSLNGDRQPVVVVNFNDVTQFADWLTRRDQAQLGGMRYRMPSEREFMTYVQCGDGREYPWGNTWPPTSGHAGNYDDEAAKRGLHYLNNIFGYDDGHAVSCDVEKSWANPWGLYGVGGNVWELCTSDNDANSIAARRGAAWNRTHLESLRCNARLAGSALNVLSGFRLVLSPPSTPASQKENDPAHPPSSVPVPPAPRRGGPEEGQNWTSPSMGMEFVWIKALGLWVGKYEVTNDEYRKMERHDSNDYKGTSKGHSKGHSLNGDRQPVVNINFSDARQFADWMTQRDQDPLGGLRYRVPTQKEFMTYVQCGDGREYPWGNNWPPTRGQAGNYGDETAKREALFSSSIPGYDDGHAVSCDVEKSWANPWGLYGVGGNVWEVCAPDNDASSSRPWCGASWGNWSPDYLRCSGSFASDGSSRNDLGGFRLVLSKPSP